MCAILPFIKTVKSVHCPKMKRDAQVNAVFFHSKKTAFTQASLFIFRHQTDVMALLITVNLMFQQLYMSVRVKKSEGPSSKARQQIQFHGLVFFIKHSRCSGLLCDASLNVRKSCILKGFCPLGKIQQILVFLTR